MGDPHSTGPEFGVESTARLANFHAAMPVLIGLAAPIMVLFAIDSRALSSANVLLHLYPLAIFVLGTVVYIINVFDQGDVTKIIFDKPARTLQIERTGLLSKKSEMLDFDDIAHIRMDWHFDDDGYKTAMPQIVLSSHDTIPLPANTTEADIAAMRQIIGRS